MAVSVPCFIFTAVVVVVSLVFYYIDLPSLGFPLLSLEPYDEKFPSTGWNTAFYLLPAAIDFLRLAAIGIAKI